MYSKIFKCSNFITQVRIEKAPLQGRPIAAVESKVGMVRRDVMMLSPNPGTPGSPACFPDACSNCCLRRLTAWHKSHPPGPVDLLLSLGDSNSPYSNVGFNVGFTDKQSREREQT
jgi:hypothetical protein